ncbi:MAG: hypothetical protein HY738_11400 [Bacteroidia bacterium]|nr:hypothetical protein [Bacteroidia bacterium]
MNKIVICIFQFAVIICICSCNTQIKKDVKPDILKYEDYLKKEIHLPYVLDLKNETKHLVYYGTEHSFNPSDTMFTDIEKRFTDLRPDIVFNEGGDDWPVINNRDSTIRLTGDPPPDSLEYKYLLSRFKKEDITLMYFCRQIEQLQNQVEISDSNFEKYMNVFFCDLKNNGILLNNDEIKYSYMKNYYEKFFQTILKWKEFDPTNYQPIYSKTLLNEICRESTYFRDRHIVSIIEETLKTKNKIFVVMGGSHLVIEEPALRYLMK